MIPILFTKLKRFLSLPFYAKLFLLRRKLGLAKWLPLLVRFPDIGWWLVIPEPRCLDPTNLSWYRELTDFVWCYDLKERKFLSRFIRPKWLVFDIGAHRGFYTLLLARQVGPQGLVVAFEPSPCERKWLQTHLWLNRHPNVRVEPFALSDEQGETEFFIYDNTVSNSLRPRNQRGTGYRIRVAMTTLDAYLERHGIDRVNFIKMDTEGAELSILNGAQGLLARKPRPIFLCELNDTATRAWGYPAKAIWKLLAEKGFVWFDITLEGDLVAHNGRDVYPAQNLLAVPEERLSEVQPFWQKDGAQDFKFP